MRKISTFSRGFLLLSLACAILLTMASPRNSQAGFFDPKLKWKTLKTEHFNIHYYEGLEEAAFRMTIIVEKVYKELSPKFKWKPWGRTEVLLTDSTDVSNGLTTTLPYNYILLFIAPPQGDSFLNYYENWLEDLFRHEFFHTIHLDMYGGSAIPFRFLLGRIITPNAMTPSWVREGMAVQQESLTGKGRSNNSFSEMLLRTDIYNDEFLALDQMAGSQYKWPGFNAGYIYGGMFWTHLADKYGQEKMVEFSHRYSDSVWLFSLNNKAKKTFHNKDFYTLHREWKQELKKKYAKQRKELTDKGITSLKRIRKIKGILSNPTLSPDGQHILYNKLDYNHKPEIRMMALDGKNDRRVHKGRTGNQYSFSPDGKKVAFSSISRHKKWYRYFDIYELDLETQKAKRITKGKRAFHPDYSPDGKKIVYVTNNVISTQLMLWDIEEEKATPITGPEPAVQYSNPRFSPDGNTIAVSLWKQGNRNIYILDLQGKVVKEISQDAAIDNNPVFSPDGQNIFFTSDLNGITNIYRYNIPTGVTSQISNVLTGVFRPQFRNGTMVLQFYNGQGYDIRSFEYTPTPLTPAAATGDEAKEGEEEAEGAQWELGKAKGAEYFDLDPALLPEIEIQPKKYNPFLKLFIPRSIIPGFFFTDDTVLLSANIGGADPLARHIWNGGITYRFDANFLGGNFLYTYNRFWPSIFVSFNDFIVSFGDLFRNGTTFFEERTIGSVGVSLAGYAKGNHRLSAFYFFENRTAESIVPPGTTTEPSLGKFAGFGLRYRFNRAITYPAGISMEGGPRLLMDLRVTDQALGSSSQNEQVVFSGDLREYVPLPLEGHVMAFRLAGGITFGDRLLQGTFRLGSATGESIISGPTPRLFTLRGLPQITFAGERALLISGEYRLPLYNPQRGLGTTPIFLKKLYLAFFADYGSVFNGDIDFNNFLLGVGAEFRMDWVLFYGLPIKTRLGYAIIVSGREFIRGLTDPITGASIENGTLILELGTSF